jgi:hypothetical protein
MEWLMSAHSDMTVLIERVHPHFADIVDRLELVGPRVDNEKIVKKLKGHHGLGEGRYRDSSGAYRFFFAFGRLGGQRVVVFTDGDRKTRDDFRPERYRRAERATGAAFDEHGVVVANDW